MDYFIFHVGGMNAYNYLGGTNYVGVWADNHIQADKKVRKYFSSGSLIRYVGEKAPKGTEVGYLH